MVMAEMFDALARDGGDLSAAMPRSVPIDLWRHFRVAELPMNLICTTAELLQSKPYLTIDRMQALRADHRTLLEQEQSHAMGRLRGSDPLDDTHDAPRIDPVVKPFASPYIYSDNLVADQSDVQELARSLECLASVGKAVGVLHHERSAAWYSKCIVPGETIPTSAPNRERCRSLANARGARVKIGDIVAWRRIVIRPDCDHSMVDSWATGLR